jgi:hypothetical protein
VIIAATLYMNGKPLSTEAFLVGLTFTTWTPPG